MTGLAVPFRIDRVPVLRGRAESLSSDRRGKVYPDHLLGAQGMPRTDSRTTATRLHSSRVPKSGMSVSWASCLR
jgi:hypothetical protein